MQKKLNSAAFLLLSAFFCFSQTSTIQSNVIANNPIFIQGVSAENHLVVDNVPAWAVAADFYVVDALSSPLGSPYAGNINGTDADTIVDMGLLDPSAVAIIVQFDDGQGYTELSSPYQFKIIPSPSWVTNNGGEITALNYDPGTANMRIQCELPIEKPTVTIPSDVIGIGGKHFGIYDNKIHFEADYVIDGGTATADMQTLSYLYRVNAFDVAFPSTPLSYDLSQVPNLNFIFYPNLNITLDAQYNLPKRLIEVLSKRWNVGIPSTPFSVGFSVGFNLDGALMGRLLYGYNSQSDSYGFIRNSITDVSSIGLAGRVEAKLQGDVSLISPSIAGIQGSLKVTGRIGAAYQFETVPLPNDSLTWGGDLRLDGKLELTGAAGYVKGALCYGTSWLTGNNCNSSEIIADGKIWPRDSDLYLINSGLPGDFHFLVATHLDNVSRSQTYQSDYFYDTPDDITQAHFDTKNDRAGVVWIESDSLHQHLFFSELDNNSNSFRPALLLNDTNFSVSSPDVALLNDGSAIIVWEQNKFVAADLIGSNMSIDNYLDAQDTWYAIYDKQQDTIIYKAKVNDQEDLPEGMPSVTISENDIAIITWLARYVEAEPAKIMDVWHTEITHNGSQWYQSDPDLLTANYWGVSSNVNVSFYSPTQAIATWLFDDDEQTEGNQILYSTFDGSIWTEPELFSHANQINTFKETAMDFTGNFGAFAFTVTEGDLNSLQVAIWNVGANSWDNQSYQDTSQSKNIRMPSVSISDNGILAVSYQTVDLFPDTNSINAGAINLVVKDLNSGSNNDWQPVSNSQLACDSNIFSWDMDLAFGANDKLYTLSHETDTTVGNFYTPTTGKLFGDPTMGLVLRGYNLTNNQGVISLSPVDSLPSTPTGIGSATIPENNLTLLVYPNPFSEKTTMDFYIPSNQFTTLEVFDLSGRKISTLISQKLSQGTYKTVFEATSLEKGFYIVKLTSGLTSKTSRIVIQ